MVAITGPQLNEGLRLKRLNIDLVQAGDIVLTARPGKVSKAIRRTTKGLVSHAMICVQHGSVIDSTSAGVQSRNLQRELFKPDERVYAFRLREPLTALQLSSLMDFARSEIGTRYSKIEAARSIIAGPRPRNSKQFCSRLVARAFASIGIPLVVDPDYCTPEELRISPLLIELKNVTETVSKEELKAWRSRPNPLALQEKSHNRILNAGRRLDSSIENFHDLHRFVQAHPQWDAHIAKVYRESGYLDLWKMDFEINPWHYDVDVMDACFPEARREEMRSACVASIREAYTGGVRFAVDLAYYRDAFAQHGLETDGQLVALYEQLVRNDQLRRDTALLWLRRHFPVDIPLHLERVVPHSDIWFSIVDRVEPRLGALARNAITKQGRSDVCSTCGDPARDYRLVNTAEAMPGVPSQRLCNDCVGMRRSFGEQLEPLS